MVRIAHEQLLIAAIILILVGMVLGFAPIPYPVDYVGEILFWIGIILFVIWLILLIIAAVKST